MTPEQRIKRLEQEFLKFRNMTKKQCNTLHQRIITSNIVIKQLRDEIKNLKLKVENSNKSKESLNSQWDNWGETTDGWDSKKEPTKTSEWDFVNTTSW